MMTLYPQALVEILNSPLCLRGAARKQWVEISTDLEMRLRSARRALDDYGDGWPDDEQFDTSAM